MVTVTKLIVKLGLWFLFVGQNLVSVSVSYSLFTKKFTTSVLFHNPENSDLSGINNLSDSRVFVWELCRLLQLNVAHLRFGDLFCFECKNAEGKSRPLYRSSTNFASGFLISEIYLGMTAILLNTKILFDTSSFAMQITIHSLLVNFMFADTTTKIKTTTNAQTNVRYNIYSVLLSWFQKHKKKIRICSFRRPSDRRKTKYPR